MTGHSPAAMLAVAAQHPLLALALVALVAFAESLAVVGTFVPAALAMFGAGVLVGHGTLGMGSTLAWAVAGAIAGDALSYELGRQPRVRARVLAQASRRPALLARAQALVQRRGAAAVLVARFTGPLRAFVPLLAGLTHMPRGRFYGINVVSALLWAPVHILPGALFGSSLQLAEAVSGRLALLLILLVLLLWAAAWAVTGLRRLLARLVAALGDAALGFLRRHDGRWARSAAQLLDPGAAGTRTLVLGTALLLAAGGIFLGVLEDVVTNAPLVQADQSVFAFLQQLRTEPADRVMVLLTEAGSVGVLLPLVVAVLAWLLWRRCWHTAAYWVAAASFGELLVQVLKHTLGRARPLALYDGGERFSFPSGHATVSMVVLGFLAFLLVRGQAQRWRIAIAAIAAMYVALVAFSRLYLGAHWFSDVMAGVSLGAAWVALVATVYSHRAGAEAYQPHRLAAVAGLVVLGSAALWHAWRGPADTQLYAQHQAARVLPAAAWQAGGWRELPRQRRELAGDQEEPFPLQWACARDGVLRALAAAGWHAASPWTVKSALLALANAADPGTLPVLPRFDQGRRDSLTLVAPAARPPGRQVLRLWSSDTEVGAAGTAVPVWYGALYLERSGHSQIRTMPAAPGDLEALALAARANRVTALQPAAAAGLAVPPLLLLCPGP